MSKPTPFKRDGEDIYKITDSSASGKKYSVKSVPSPSSTDNPKTINFGDSSRSDQNQTKAQTERYYRRAFLIKDGSGKLTLNNPMSSNFWAIRHIWGNTHGIKRLTVDDYTFTIKR